MIKITRRDYRGGHRYYVDGDDRLDSTKALPSCTGIAGYADNSGADGLMTWAVNLFQDTGNRLEYKDNNAAARGIGTLLHAQIEEYLEAGDSQIQFPNSPLFGAWYSSVNERGVEFISQEMLVYNPYLKYGGTLDAVGYVDGRLTLFDWKTTDEYRIRRNKDGTIARQNGKVITQRKQFNQSVGNAVQLGGYILALKAMAEKEKTLVPEQAYIVYIFKDTLKTEWVKVNLPAAERVFTDCATLHLTMKHSKAGGLYEL